MVGAFLIKNEFEIQCIFQIFAKKRSFPRGFFGAKNFSKNPYIGSSIDLSVRIFLIFFESVTSGSFPADAHSWEAQGALIYIMQ